MKTDGINELFKPHETGHDSTLRQSAALRTVGQHCHRRLVLCFQPQRERRCSSTSHSLLSHPSLVRTPALRKSPNWAGAAQSQTELLSGFCELYPRRSAVLKNQSGRETRNAPAELPQQSWTAPAPERYPLSLVLLLC